MFTEAHYRAVLNFFYFLLLDEQAAVNAAVKTIATAQKFLKDDSQKNKDVILIQTMVRILDKYRHKYVSKALPAGRTSIPSEWDIPKPESLVLWKEFLRRGDMDMADVLVLRYILRYPPAVIAEALNVPEGTVFFRIGRGLEFFAVNPSLFSMVSP